VYYTSVVAEYCNLETLESLLFTSLQTFIFSLTLKAMMPVTV